MPPVPRVSVVVPTRDRPDQLAKCIAGIADSAKGQGVELIVADDGSESPLTVPLDGDIEATVLRLHGGGPAAARNAGAGAAHADIVLFTDDDTIPTSTWVGAAAEYLESHPHAVGVTGPIRSVPWDRLYEQSIATESAGSASRGRYLTCNIAYRRDVLTQLGGFRADVFVHAHAEDRDLAVRALAIGEIGFAPGMIVSHTPRRLRVRDVARQGRWARDDLTLYALHPQLADDFTLPVRLALVSDAGRKWIRRGIRVPPGRSPKRVLRGSLLGVVALTSTAWSVLPAPPMRALRARHRPRTS